MRLDQTTTAPGAPGTVNEQASSVSKTRNLLHNTPIHLLLLVGAVLWTIPFVWMVGTSFSVRNIRVSTNGGL